MIEQFIREANCFYRRWHTFESNLTTDNGSVLDFDYCPIELGWDQIKYSSRLDALEELEELQAVLCSLKESDFSNKEFFSHKLRGANAYLRALLGERIPFAKYVEETLGLKPRLTSKDKLDELKFEAARHIEQLGLVWQESSRPDYFKITQYPSPKQFGQNLRELASTWVQRVKSRLSLDLEPIYWLETVEVDAYWLNWIERKLGEDITLRVNLHPRRKMHIGQDEILAVHEIAGHALQVLSLDSNCRKGRLETTLMNTTVHSCEMFQMEGLAQTLIHLLAKDGEISEAIYLQEALETYHKALTNNAQIEIEAGAPVDTVIKNTLALAPFINPLEFTSDIRDRSRNQLFRAYVSVYYPSAEMFRRAIGLSEEKRQEFLKDMYSCFWTPGQIDAMLNNLGV